MNIAVLKSDLRTFLSVSSTVASNVTALFTDTIAGMLVGTLLLGAGALYTLAYALNAFTPGA